MRLLPEWILTNPTPAINDKESLTAIQMVAKLYGAMNELITEYNKFVEDTNKNISDFENQVRTDHEEFETALRQEFQDFIDAVDLKIEGIKQETLNYVLAQITPIVQATCTEEIGKAIETIALQETYNSESGNLDLNVGTGE